MSFLLNLFGLASPSRPSSATPKVEAITPAQVPEPDAASRAQPKPEALPTPFGIGDTPTAAEPAPTQHDIRGALDNFQAPGSLSGWALDATNPTNLLNIQVLLDGQQIAAGVTSFGRSDLRETGNTAGFRIDTEKNVDKDQIVGGRIKILADGQPISIWTGLINKLTAPN